MRDYRRFYIDGQWVAPTGTRVLPVENPATAAVCGQIALGEAADVDRAVGAARRAFPGWAASSRPERIELLQAIAAEYQRRTPELIEAVTEEMGAPLALSTRAQVPMGSAHIAMAIEILKTFPFEEQREKSLILREPIGVCGLITPWNWPLNQIVVKAIPALATGCAMVLKPSEIAPFSGHLFAEVMHAVGVPAGVFNLVHGDGPGVGTALSGHPDIDMISFTGSTRAGVEIARNAAPTVKRVAQELGGKSPNIIMDDDGFAAHVAGGVAAMMGNTGQTCSAPSRMLVPHARMDEAIAIARETAEGIEVGDPLGNARMGPLASRVQFDKVQSLIEIGIAEGAELVAGGPGRPEGLGERVSQGYFARPTVFARVTNTMTIAREEVFGPVLAILGYDDLDDAVNIANDTEYGLAAYVRGTDQAAACALARRLRAGQVTVNGAQDLTAPFGGFKRSGNGREWGEWGFADFVEMKAVIGQTG